jgi:NAD(P)-dependent dehydrogenase (short-subunit alcohol dehydrogenase family)
MVGLRGYGIDFEAASAHHRARRPREGGAQPMSNLSDPMAAFRLDGRVALVTGARREIGRAIATALAAQGAAVAIHHAGGAEEERDAADVVAAISAAGGRAIAFAADFAADGAPERLGADVLAAFGKVDILVVNASIEILEDWDRIGRAAFDRQVAVNLWATLALLQALAPGMIARGWGRIVTIGSIQQQQPHPRMLVYAGTKAAQHNWAVNLARQFGGTGVTVNNLSPGVIATARNREQLATDGGKLLARVPLGRTGTPADLVGAALLLCTDAGAYIHGADILVDGGRAIS